MSRIGKQPIALPQGVEVKLDGCAISVKGPKGVLSRNLHSAMQLQIEDNVITVKKPESKQYDSLYGLTRTLVNNMVVGVTQGFTKNLEMNGVGYKAALQGKTLVLNVGYSHPVEIIPPEGIEIEVPSQTKITVKGMDKEKVGAVAANIRSVREPEPYKGKGIKYENEHIRRKAGKAGAKK